MGTRVWNWPASQKLYKDGPLSSFCPHRTSFPESLIPSHSSAKYLCYVTDERYHYWVRFLLIKPTEQRAGVIGLTTALRLHEEGYHVVVIARHRPKDRDINYTSPWAGAHYRPIPDTDAITRFEADLATVSHEKFKSIAEMDESSGVKLMDGFEYFDVPSDAYLKLEGRYSQIDGFRILEASQLPTGVELGVTYKTWCLNSPVYLAWLERRLVLGGVQFIERNLVDLMEAFSIANDIEDSVLINCSGIGFSDRNVYPTRGIILTPEI